jgi:L-seryl-tRNA(Ser) seleniumtransferase
LPEETQPSRAARRRRRADPPVIARIIDDRVVLDLRSVLPEQDAQLAAAVEGALARSR